MSEEEWLFWVIVAGGGILAGAIVIADVFSLQKFWARLTRSRNPPTPETIAKAYTRHQRFYHKTDQRLFSTTYVSFYLFTLSFLGILFLNAYILIQDMLRGLDYNADERLLRLMYILFFFLLSRWYYRQEHHYTTAHKLMCILLCIIMIDLVHFLTGKDYIQVTCILLICWAWMIGVLRAVLSYEVNYARDVAFSVGIPTAMVYYLIRPDAFVIFLIMAPVFILALREFITKSREYKRVEHFFHSLPFKPVQPDSFRRDILHTLLFRETLAGCSALEVLFWGFTTPFVLIPVAVYLQGREEQLQQWHDSIVTWSQNEYVLDPDTVADRLGLTLQDTYPLLNELTEEGKLALYEGVRGLLYGLPPSEEMDAFTRKLNLRKAHLPTKDRELLEYIAGKGRITPPKAAILSIVKRPDGVEVSAERAGGTISALKSSALMDTVENFVLASRDITFLVRKTVATLGYFGQFKLRDPRMFLSLLQKKGETLLEYTIPEQIVQKLDMSHLILETNVHDTPFELMWSDQFFALKYAVGRRLRISGAAETETEVKAKPPEDTEPLRALIIADPEGNLGGAVRECDYLEAELDRLVETHYVKQESATCDRVLSCFHSGYTIIHYAGHVEEHGLQLSDGILDSAVIQKSMKGHPIVFINGCESVGIAHIGLAEAFLRGGALGYIGSLWDIHDTAAAQLAIDFYVTCLHYHTLGEALRMAKERAFEEHSVSWLCFVLFGDPTLRLI